MADIHFHIQRAIPMSKLLEKNPESVVRKFTKEEAARWLSELGLAVSGSKEELIQRILKYKRYPKLVEKLRHRTSRNRLFPCSLDPLLIPPATAKWQTKDELFPKVTNNMFKKYASQKIQGSQGQQEKAYRMLQSRKIVSVKTMTDQNQIYVIGMIKKSYGCELRPAVILFIDSLPKKSFCSCPIGTSGLCCHVLALLLFLQHFTDSNEKLLELTCTQQLQKWHRRTCKGSIPMVPLSQIKLRSAMRRKVKNSVVISAADPEQSTSKRDIPSIIKQIEQNLEASKPVIEHFHSVLSNSEIGRNSSYGQHVCFNFMLDKVMDHQYICEKDFDTNILGIPEGKMEKIEEIAFGKTCAVSSQSDKEQHNHTITIDDILKQEHFDIVVTKFQGVYNHDDIYQPIYADIEKELLKKNNVVNLDICFLEAPAPSGDNYINTTQKSDAWHSVRKFKITGSRLPSVLGFHGRTKYEEFWDIVLNGKEDKNMLTGITNIQRGNMYESEALAYFHKSSKAKSSQCGFFLHPTNKRYGASPDALGPSGLLIEIKTRGINSDGPIKSLEKFPSYFIQCQLQMECTDAHSCVLLSYHPESKEGNFFLITRDHVLMNIVIDACDSISNNRMLLDWYHNETKELQILGKGITGKKLDFDSLKTLRIYIKRCVKNIPLLNFVDEISLEL